MSYIWEGISGVGRWNNLKRTDCAFFSNFYYLYHVKIETLQSLSFRYPDVLDLEINLENLGILAVLFQEKG